MDKEIWRDILGYEDLYQVSNYGRIRSLIKWNFGKRCFEKTYYIKKTRIDYEGYEKVKLAKNTKDKEYFVHRLVAETFILNKADFKSMPDEDRTKIDLDKLQVNHKDENKQNNCVDNLEWCTNLYNSYYGTRIRRIRKTISKGVIVRKNNKYVGTYLNCVEASKNINVPVGTIRAIISGHRKSRKGYTFKYKQAKRII